MVPGVCGLLQSSHFLFHVSERAVDSLQVALQRLLPLLLLATQLLQQRSLLLQQEAVQRLEVGLDALLKLGTHFLSGVEGRVEGGQGGQEETQENLSTSEGSVGHPAPHHFEKKKKKHIDTVKLGWMLKLGK